MEIRESRKLIQIVPRILPSRCGVSDHALALADELRRSFQVESVFIALNQPHPVEGVVSCKADQIEQVCEIWRKRGAESVLAHVSGYGYSKTGIPANLARSLRILQAGHNYRTAAFFHELYASGKPWQKAFWYSRLQRRAVRQIAETCDMVLTNTELHARRLRSESELHCSEVLVRPVFSTVGEAEEPLPFAQRLPVMVVFGLAGSRRRSYMLLQEMKKELKVLAVESIIDIGPESIAPEHVHHIPIYSLGVLSSSKVIEQISRARYGFVPHEPCCVAKSSIFAAYCAHGTIPVLSEAFATTFDQLKDGVHLVSKSMICNLDSETIATCSRNAFHWYSAHNLRSQAEFYSRWVRGEK